MDLPFCYAVTGIKINGRTQFLFASDDRNPCYCLDIRTFEKQTVWEAPGGTMAMVPVPERNGDFLAIQLFNPGFQAQEAQVVQAQYQNGRWDVRTLFKLPYVHRLDILERAGVRYLIACTVCASKKFEQDWSSPGAIYATELPADISRIVSLKQIAGGMHRNHGFWPLRYNDFKAGLTSCDEGVFEVLPPERLGGDWQVRCILGRPVSDLAIADIDGDGIPEMAAIEPFHGSEFNVYRRMEAGYIPFYRYPRELPFGHAIWGGRLRSRPVFIGGCRAGSQELFMLRWENGRIVDEVIDSGCSPANVAVISGDEYDLLAVASRETGRGVIYSVRDS